METMKANEGKVFAYLDEDGNEVILGEELYLGVEDDGSRYYEVDKPDNADEEVITPEPAEAEPTEVEEPTE